MRKLYKELGSASLADLENAARSGKLAATKGEDRSSHVTLKFAA